MEPFFANNSFMYFNSTRSSTVLITDTVVGVLLIIIDLAAIILNGLVIAVGITKHRHISPQDYYIFNLAVLDILMPVAAYPMTIYSTLNHEWTFGRSGCVYYGFLGYFTGVANITTLTIISIVRYLKTCRPFGAGSRINHRTVLYSIAFIHLYSLVWNVLPFFGFGHYGFEPSGVSCGLRWQDSGNSSSDMVHILCVMTGCFFLPIIIMVMSYTAIVRKVKNSRNNVRTNNSIGSQPTEKHMHILKISVCMSVCFILAWMPYCTVGFLAIDGHHVDMAWASFPPLFAKASNALNPIIYFFFNKKLRTYVQLMFPVCFRTSVYGQDAVDNSTNRSQLDGFPEIPGTSLSRSKVRHKRRRKKHRTHSVAHCSLQTTGITTTTPVLESKPTGARPYQIEVTIHAADNDEFKESETPSMTSTNIIKVASGQEKTFVPRHPLAGGKTPEIIELPPVM